MTDSRDELRIRIALSTGESFAAWLYPNPVAAELASLLPLTLEFTDFNGVEKVARAGVTRRLQGVPEQDAPLPGEIGYYAPTRGLVLYYGHAGQWPGLVRLGPFDLDLGVLRALPDGFTAVLTHD